jgi:hypothetical protein
VTTPELGAPLAGAPVTLGGAGGAPIGVGAPPVAIAALASPGALAKSAAVATIENNLPPGRRRTLDVLRTTFLSFARLRG